MRKTDSIAAPSAGHLVHALDFLSAAAGVESDHDEALKAVRRNIRAAGANIARSHGLARALSRSGGDLGLALAHSTCSLAEALREARPNAPWVALPEGDPEDFIAVIDSGGRTVEIQRLNAEDGSRQVSRRELRTLLGVDSDEQDIEWVTAEPAAPLSDLRSPEGKSLDGDPITRLRALLRAERSDLWVVVAYSVGVGLLSLVLPVAVQSLVNTVAFGSLLQPLVVLTLFVFAALSFSALMNAFRVWVVEVIQRRIFARVSADVTYRLLRVRTSAFDRHHGPELVNRFFDVVTVQKAGALLLMDGLSIFMQTLVGMVLLAVYHPLLLAFDVLLVAAMCFIIFVLGRGAIKTAIKESKAKYSMAAWLEGLAADPTVFKSPGASAYAAEQSDNLVRNYLNQRRDHFRIVMRQIVGSLALQAIASSVLLGIGGWLVIQRQLTLGQLVAAELIVTVVVGGFSKFGKKFETFYDLSAAIDKLGQLIDLPLERAGGERLRLAAGPAAVEFRGVSFSFAADRPVLRSADWKIEPGERLGLIGPSGSGKSTLIDMLFGLRTPQSGVMTLDGLDYRDLCLQDLRAHVAVVHGPEIFEGTVFDNVALGREGVGLEEVYEALRTVRLLDETLTLPDGLQTVLSFGGRPLSPGQQARMMLARAILGRPRLLLLDDILGRIDDIRDREAVYDALFAPDAPWTLLCVSESPDILDRCDRVCVIDGGEVSELGRRARHAPTSTGGEEHHG